MNLRTRKLMAKLSLLGSSIAILSGSNARAQASASTQSVEKMEKFVVTGSYIPTNETAFSAGASPVVRIDQKTIEQSGLSTVSELLQRVTVSNGNSVPISNGANTNTGGASSISLRGLGPEATLVLINGRRVAPYPIGAGGTTAFVDLNSIPIAAIETIEVLKDGASAIYGADAVAGVVNIKMRRGMDGTEAFLSYGNTTNKDSSEFMASLVTGAQNDKASAMVGFNYYKRNAIFNRDRGYSEIPPFLSSNASPLNLQITRAAALAAGIPATSIPGGAATNTFYVSSPATSANNGASPVSAYSIGRTATSRPTAFNFNEFSMSYPRRDNRGMFAYAERKVFGTENIKAYVDATYQNAVTENQLAPGATGSFTTSGQVELVIPARTTSPLPTTDGRTRAQLAATNNGGFSANAINPFNPFNQDITGGSRARLAEFGNRIYLNTTDAVLLTAGIKGENIAGKWNFDAGYSYSSIRDTSRNTVPSSARFNRLLNGNDSFFQPGSSDFLGTTIPYNPFGYYKVSIPNNEKIVGAGLITSKDMNESKLNQFNANMSTGNLFELPAGAVGFAFGADARHEQLNQFPDPYSLTGDLIGSSAGAITRGHRKVWGVFAEGNFPLLKNVPGAHSLSATAAVRHEDFMTEAETTTVPKIGLRWQPLDDSLTLRGSWSKGTRQPSLYEMYSSPTSGLIPIVHPLGTFPFEPEQAVTVSGNRRLQPEKTKYLNTGFVWSPQAKPLKGLTLGVDYWEAERRGTVSNDYQNTVNRFFGRVPKGAAGSAPGGLLPGESVVLYPDGSINVVNSVFFNVGLTKVAGFDYSASYVVKTDSLGRFEASTVWSTFTHYKSTKIGGAALLEKVSQPTENSTGSDDAIIKWKGRTQVEWAYRSLSVVLGGNFTDGFNDTADDTDPKATFWVASRWIFDLQASYKFQNKFGPWLSDTKVTVGSRNVFDRDPPFASGNSGNSTGYPGYLYNSEGRFWYVSLSRKF